MKKIIILFLLLFTLPLYACNQGGSDLSLPPVVDITPLPDIPTDEEENEDASKKKSYIVSTVNGLRIRKSANSSSTILGYLDKNDALFLIEKPTSSNFFASKCAFSYDFCAISINPDLPSFLRYKFAQNATNA